MEATCRENMSRSRCSGIILAGGEASRFGGRDKGLERVGGRRIIDRVADALRAASDELVIVANAADAPRWIDNARVVRDVLHERGSLAGLYTALATVSDACLVVAWDMPFVPPALLSALREEGERSQSVVVPEANGRMQPFCAYYRRDAIDTAKRLLDGEDRRMTSFLDGLPRIVRFSEMRCREFGDPQTMFFNVNASEDLERARQVANGSRPA